MKHLVSSDDDFNFSDLTIFLTKMFLSDKAVNLIKQLNLFEKTINILRRDSQSFLMIHIFMFGGLVEPF
jgi:hypothetical protein